MKIAKIRLSELNIPFRYTFKHASADRSQTQSLWIELHTRENIVGYGESCPREYVTSESLVSGRDFISRVEQEFYDEDWDMDKLRLWIRENKRLIDSNPAAWCVLELALLDALAKGAQQSVEGLIGSSEISGKFFYSAVIGDAPKQQFDNWLSKYLELNMHDFKLKLSGDKIKDHQRIETILHATNEHCLIRVDANNLFDSAKEAIEYCNDFSDAIFAIEEPLKPRQFDQLTDIANQLNVKIILDESFTSIDDFEYIGGADTPWIINLRVSKLGGLLRSIEAARQARLLRIPVIVGAHVGETSLLTRVAISVANGIKDILLAQEGGFGTYFLQNDVCEKSLRFGINGCIDESSINKQGYGFSVR